jgi:polyisoprenoid-binding protein YceI
LFTIPSLLVRVVWTVLLAGPLSTLSYGQTPGSYRIQPQASRIEIHLFRAGILGGLGDNHLIVVGRFSGTAEESPGKSWSVHVLAESGSLEVVDPGTSAATRRQVQESMLGPTQLDIAHYPLIEVRSLSLRPGDTGNSWRMLAEVSLHGASREVEFYVTWSEAGNQMRVWGKKTLRLRDFNIQPVRKALGTVRVRNEFELVYDITLKRQS